MFSGIIKELGTVKNINNGILSLAASVTGKNAYIGQSIAVNGLCLTVKKITYPVIYFDFTPETLRVSAIKYLKINEKVNIEPALSVNSDISGHFVLGHVDGIGKITAKNKEGNSIIIGIKVINSIDGDIKKYIIKKGSIGIDGISLTVANIKEGIFFASIIPLTYEKTNLKFKSVGDYVNLESDIIGKTVMNSINNMAEAPDGDKLTNGGSGLTMDFLSENGFI
jgi:riboflavin synthase